MRFAVRSNVLHAAKPGSQAFRRVEGSHRPPFANGLYWISVYVHGKKIDAPSWTPGTAVDYNVAVQQDLGKPVLIRANAYLPIKRIQSNAKHTFQFPKACDDENPCTNPEEDGVQCGTLPCCCPYLYAPVGENFACEYVGA